MFNFKRTVCDCCGKVNPPMLDKRGRLTTCCIVKGGFYSIGSNTGYGTNGKITTEYFQFPFKFEWVGFWTWHRPAKKEPVIKRRCPKCNKKMDTKELEKHIKYTCPKRPIIPIEWCNL